MQTAPAALIAITETKIQQNTQSNQTSEQASKWFPKSGLTQVFCLHCALFFPYHIVTNNELDWVYSYFRVSTFHQSSQCPKNMIYIHWQIVHTSEYGAMYFWRPTKLAVVCMLLLPSTSLELVISMGNKSFMKKRNKGGSTDASKFGCAFLTW